MAKILAPKFDECVSTILNSILTEFYDATMKLFHTRWKTTIGGDTSNATPTEEVRMALGRFCGSFMGVGSDHIIQHSKVSARTYYENRAFCPINSRVPDRWMYSPQQTLPVHFPS
ncbi:hypothetical protein BDR05DRAFT_669331 [Suillus weaverae]|nr:hypothetical protein BDR05DRAFT_669331 [Suillus weaverae]